MSWKGRFKSIFFREKLPPQGGQPTASPAQYPQGARRIRKAAKPPMAAQRVAVRKEEQGSGRMTSFLPQAKKTSEQSGLCSDVDRGGQNRYFLIIRKYRRAAAAPNRSPAQRVRFGKEEQRRERALTFEKSRSKRYKACSDVVPVVGLEPTRYRYQRILSPSRLPIPSHRRKETHLLYKRHPENSRGSFLFRRRKMNRP